MTNLTPTTFNLDIGGEKFSVPKTQLEQHGYFSEGFFLRWQNNTTIKIQTDEFEESPDESRKIIITLLTNQPLTIFAYPTCLKYLRYASYFDSHTLMTQCVAYIRQHLTQKNVYDTYLDVCDYITDTNFRDVCLIQMGLTLADNFKRLIPDNLFILAILSDTRYSRFSTQYEKYIFVKETLVPSLFQDTPPIFEHLEQFNYQNLDRKKCIQIWLSSINYLAFSSLEFKSFKLDTLISNKDKIIQKRENLIDCVIRKKIVDEPFTLSFDLVLYRSNGITGLSRYVRDYEIVSSRPIEFGGLLWRIETRLDKRDENDIGIFVFAEIQREFSTYYNNPIGVEFSLECPIINSMHTKPGAYLTPGNGWGWQTLTSSSELFNCDQALKNSFKSQKRTIRIMIKVKRFNI